MPVTIRPYVHADRDGVLRLAPRLTEGVAAWRDPGAVADQVVDWVRGSVDEHHVDGHLVLVAEHSDGLVGFACAAQARHWSGSLDACIGELVVAEGWEGAGVGRRLVESVCSWARQRGLATVTLETGAGNVRAREFYAALGFLEEEVSLALPLT